MKGWRAEGLRTRGVWPPMLASPTKKSTTRSASCALPIAIALVVTIANVVIADDEILALNSPAVIPYAVASVLSPKASSSSSRSPQPSAVLESLFPLMIPACR